MSPKGCDTDTHAKTHTVPFFPSPSFSLPSSVISGAGGAGEQMAGHCTACFSSSALRRSLLCAFCVALSQAAPPHPHGVGHVSLKETAHQKGQDCVKKWMTPGHAQFVDHNPQATLRPRREGSAGSGVTSRLPRSSGVSVPGPSLAHTESSAGAVAYARGRGNAVVGVCIRGPVWV